MGGFRQVPPKEGRGRCLGSARSSSAVTLRLFVAELSPHTTQMEPQLIYKGSKNICWIIKGSHSTAYVLARLFDSLKSPV